MSQTQPSVYETCLMDDWRDGVRAGFRCWYHRLANIRAKLPAEGADEVLAHVQAVRDARRWRRASTRLPQ